MSGQQDWEAGAVDLKLNCVILTIDLGKLVEARYVLDYGKDYGNERSPLGCTILGRQ
jgi:hypothetical protein